MTRMTTGFSRFLPLLMMVLLLATPHLLPAQDDLPTAEPDALVAPPPDAADAADALEGEHSSARTPSDPEPATFVAQLNTALDSTVGVANEYLTKVLFFDVSFGLLAPANLPLIVFMLFAGALMFTVYFNFINFRAMAHSISVIKGDYDNPEDDGDVSHFRALTSALSATVGLGNIAGVALAIQMGGPGAVFWMTVVGLLGMSSKFVECTLGQMFRRHNPDGTISGGPMYYLEQGLRQVNPSLWGLGKVLAVMAAFMVMGGAIGGGNMFQANQSYAAVEAAARDVAGNPELQFQALYGIVLMIMVSVVVIGGIKRIGAATARIVPIMAGIYVLAALAVLVMNIEKVPGAIGVVLKGVYDPDAAVVGGVVAVLIIGIRRAAFSNEAGLGSAAIAHSAAKTKEPVREGIVALMEPFIDTVIICNMTALVIILTGAYADTSVTNGIVMTKDAFGSQISWFPIVLAICVVLFAYSTMISWCYYGERGWIFLLDHVQEGLGYKTLIYFRITFVLFIYVGAVINLSSVIDFSDLMILSMAFPNIIGCVILAPLVKRALNDYWARYKSGQMPKIKR